MRISDNDALTNIAGLSGRDLANIQTQIAAGKYRAYKLKNNSFVSSNPAHGWQIHYAADGTVTLKSRDPEAQDYHLSLKLGAVGFTELQTLDHPRQISADDFTVSYQWNDYLREWWVNSETGLEQWFELEHRPLGAHSGQPLTLEITLATDLESNQNGNALSFVNSAGTTISYNKLKAWDAGGRELPARMQLLAGQLSLVIDDKHARYPITIDPSIVQQAYLKASNTGPDDLFGGSVAIAGDTLVVGAPSEDSDGSSEANNSANGAGAAYVFTRSGTTWTQQAYLKASNTGSVDQFGRSVAIAGDTVVVGAPSEDSDGSSEANNSVAEAGAAYVFTRNGTTWTQQAYLKASNTGARDLFGTSVAIAGDMVVVGAPSEDSDGSSEANNSAANAGAAYVFTRSSKTWTQQAYLKASNIGTLDVFGSSVAIADDTVVVGAFAEDSDGSSEANDLADRAGAAYVFTRSGTTWTQKAYLKASNTGRFDEFGFSVSVSGDTVVVGATGEGSDRNSETNNSANGAGAAYVFTRSGTTWTQQAYLKASNTGASDGFGWSVAIAGDTVVVSALFEDSDGSSEANNSAVRAGAAYVFTRNGTTWTQQAYLKASNTGDRDLFGASVTIAGDTVVVGASRESSDGSSGADNSAFSSGASYVFDIAAIDQIPSPDTTTLFSVSKIHDDNNPQQVTVGLICEGVISVTPDFAKASNDTPAEFEVLRSGTGSRSACTAYESSEHDGYTVDESDCREVDLTEKSKQGCTIYNKQDPVDVEVNKEFLDGNPMAVEFMLTCDSGEVEIYESFASVNENARFVVKDIPFSGTTCSAFETMPVGYIQESSTCLEISISPGNGNVCSVSNKPKTPEEPDPTAITSSWYDPASSGEGFMIHAVAENLAVGYFYGYDNEKDRLWLIGVSEGPFEWGKPDLFDAQVVTGGSFTNFNAEEVITSPWGTFEFTQWDCDTATIRLNGNHGEKTLQVVRLAATSGSSCSEAESTEATDAVTGSWYEQETSGQGFSVHKISNDHGIIYFFGYNDDGNNLWLIGVWEGEWAFGQEFVIPMDQAIGGTFDEVDPDQIVIESWGTLTLRFDDCTTGWAKMNGNDGEQELELVQLAGSLGLECIAEE